MFCTNCGKEMPEGVIKCPACGKEVKNSEINFAGVANFAGEQFNKAVAGASSKAKAGADAYKKEQEERNVNSVSEIVADPSETQISVLGGNYLSNMLHGGGLSKGFGILTDKRFYFKGKCFTKLGTAHKLVNEEYTIDLEDITATGFIYSRRFPLLLAALVFAVFGILFASDYNGEEMAIFCWIIGVIFLVAYALLKRAFYEVYFAGGNICVNVSKYGGMKEVREFNKQLRIAKDKAKQS